MAVNRYMKPAKQELINTYVPLPFKEMSMAYARKQKDHEEAELFSEQLDDELLKVKASRPLDKKVLTDYRGNLETSLSDLYDKHQGRYADMLPELKQMKKKVDMDLSEGVLYNIASSTSQGGLKSKAVQEAGEDYDDFWNPKMAAERDHTTWYSEGLVLKDGEWVLSEDAVNYAGNVLSGEEDLSTYSYKGIHPKVDPEAETDALFSDIKADVEKKVRENKETKMTWSEEDSQISLSKIYSTAANAYGSRSFSGPFRNEIDYHVNNFMGDADRSAGATNAIQNIYGSDTYIDNQVKKGNYSKEYADKLKAQRDDLLSEVQNDGGSDIAKNYAAINYIGAQGERFSMSDVATSLTWENDDDGIGADGFTTIDYIETVKGQTPFVTMGRVNDPSSGEGISGKNNSIQLANDAVITANDNYKNQQKILDSYIDNGGTDPEVIKRYTENTEAAKDRLNRLAFSQRNLMQKAANNINLRKQFVSNGYGGRMLQYSWTAPDGSQVVMNANHANSPTASVRMQWQGLQNMMNLIDFDDQGQPMVMDKWDGKTELTGNWLNYNYASGLLTEFNRYGDLGNFLMNEMKDVADNFGGQKNANGEVYQDGWYGGRINELPTVNTSLRESLDDVALDDLQKQWGQDDYNFVDGKGGTVRLQQLLNDKIITQDDINTLFDKDAQVRFITSPDPYGKFKGIINIPTTGTKAQNTTSMSLYFEAPKEVSDNWLLFTEVIDPGSGRKGVRPSTEGEITTKILHRAAQQDLAIAGTTPGDLAPSSILNDENRPVGFYYFSRTPDGKPMADGTVLFKPRAGTVLDVLPNGDYVYADGSELFDASTETSQMQSIIALNSDNHTAQKEVLMKGVLSNDNERSALPIATNSTVLTDRSEARDIDIDGNPFTTILNKGQYLYSGGTVQDDGAYKGLKTPFAGNLMDGFRTWGDNMTDKIENKIAPLFKGSDKVVIMNDGTDKSFDEVANMNYGEGILGVFPSFMHNVNDQAYGASVPFGGARSYATQKSMYDAWVAGGKKGDPIANPAEGGFHVMGQAIDLSQDSSAYDFFVKVGPNIQSIDGVSVEEIEVKDQFGNTKTERGIPVSKLSVNGSKVMPNYYNFALTNLFDVLGEPNQLGNRGENEDAPNIRQLPTEWWHWSVGEVTRPNSAGLYPSWAK
mgnify:CR=1 FL=1